VWDESLGDGMEAWALDVAISPAKIAQKINVRIFPIFILE
jgi:hypothetical protein